MSEPPERTALYRLYDAEDRLLYVGITTNPKVRWRAHARDKRWWPEVARKTIEWFETRKSAERVEKIEVEEESPVYNRNFNGDRRRELQNEDLRGTEDNVPATRQSIPEWYWRYVICDAE
ncbi:GIY-YIG nuclease family protein [Streptomyces sp. NPDC091412]|uniref:GIY-YIG nuclease family protein n=1 Tax=Streptomyces sp. NPDC091412 TaxID=3366002 RepID=UPI00381E189B